MLDKGDRRLVMQTAIEQNCKGDCRENHSDYDICDEIIIDGVEAWSCLRKEGHKGDHIACGIVHHNCFIWQTTNKNGGD